jgi:hypothetical protein
MEKIFQILAVFVLLMLVITYSIRGRESRYREYVFTGRFTFPLFPGTEELLSAVLGEDQPAEAEDTANRLLFRRGEERALEVADAGTGHPLFLLPLEEETDGILFDPGASLIYCCSLSGRLTVVRQLGRENYKVMQELAVPPGAARFSLDPHNGKLYVQAGTFVSVYSPS